MNKKKIISFSVYGTNPKYIDGALRNMELQPKIYPDWQCRFYVDNRQKDSLVNGLLDMGAEVVLKEPEDGHLGAHWRFECLKDTSIERFIVRDTDSRLNVREAAAVKQWEESGKEFHIMRDNPAHNVYICAGMWGATDRFIEKVKDKYDEYKSDYFRMLPFSQANGYSRGRYFFTDQLWLWKYIWPRILNTHIAHIQDLQTLRYTNRELLFPMENPDKSFVGQPFD